MTQKNYSRFFFDTLCMNVLPEAEVKLTSDQVYEEYMKWQNGGGENERSKGSILTELKLKEIKGVSEIRSVEQGPVTHGKGTPEERTVLETKQLRHYIINLDELRDE